MKGIFVFAFVCVLLGTAQAVSFESPVEEVGKFDFVKCANDLVTLLTQFKSVLDLVLAETIDMSVLIATLVGILNTFKLMGEDCI